MLVDRARSSDAAEVESLLDSVTTWQLERGISLWRLGQFGDEVRSVIAAGDLHVGRDDGMIIGCFMLEADCPDWLAPWLVEHDRSPADAMYLGRLAVARHPSSRGLGLELLGSASALAADAGFAHVRLNCPAENGRLRRYYLAAGFSSLGEVDLRGPHGEDWVCSVFERRCKLDSPDDTP
jgi:protein-tyrosine phosphatase